MVMDGPGIICRPLFPWYQVPDPMADLHVLVGPPVTHSRTQTTEGLPPTATAPPQPSYNLNPMYPALPSSILRHPQARSQGVDVGAPQGKKGPHIGAQETAF